jgi:alpha-tubulin suppressor-like RCC1 family protein
MMGAAGVSTTALFSIWGWGRNDNGQLGDGTTTNRSSPVQMGDLSTWTKLDYLGTASSGVVNSAGELWVWGGNAQGQLGLGDLTNRSSPTQVGSLTDWAAVSSGARFMLAVKTDGTLWSWGWNSDGQLGNGNTTQICSPVQVGSLTDWSSERGKFVTDSSASFAIKTDGTLWSWGDKGSGHLGLNDMTSRSSPTQVGSLTDWAWIHSSQPTSGVVKTDGTLWTWGGATNGQLGNGTDSGDISSPIQIGSLTNWSKTNGANGQFLALKTDGTLWAWGAGGSGRLGLGDTTNRSSPTQIGSLTDWDDVNTIQEAGSAIKTDGTLWTWGANSQGECGNGGTTATSSPAQVGSLTDWVDLTGAFQCGFASRSA